MSPGTIAFFHNLTSDLNFDQLFAKNKVFSKDGDYFSYTDRDMWKSTKLEKIPSFSNNPSFINSKNSLFWPYQWQFMLTQKCPLLIRVKINCSFNGCKVICRLTYCILLNIMTFFLLVDVIVSFSCCLIT